MKVDKQIFERKIGNSTTTQMLFFSVVFLLLGLVAYYPQITSVPYDMGHYVNQALNIVMGNGFLDIDWSLPERGPMFPLFLALSYIMGGVDINSAMWVVRLFAAVNIVLVFIIASLLFRIRVGVAAALLCLSSFGLQHWGYNHIDPVLAFFCLVTCLCYLQGLIFGSSLYVFLAGIFCGLALLTKESAILLLGLPFTALAMKASPNATLSHAMRYVAAGTLTVMLGILYLSFNVQGEATLKPFLDKTLWAMQSLTGDTISDQTGFFEYLIVLFRGLMNFFAGDRMSLTSYFRLTLLFPLALLFCVTSAWRGNHSHRYLLSAFLCFSPLILVVGVMGSRQGQVLFLHYLFFIMTAAAINMIFTYHHFSSKMLRIISYFAAIVFLVAWQLSPWPDSSLSGARAWVNSYPLHAAIGNDEKDFTGIFRHDLQGCKEYLQKQVSPGSKIMFVREGDAFPLYFSTRGKFPMFKAPLISTAQTTSPASQMEQTPIYLDSFLPYPALLNPVRGFGEESLLAELDSKKIDYVIVVNKFRAMAQYFQASQSFEEIKKGSLSGCRMFKVGPLEPSPQARQKVMVTVRLTKYLKKLRKVDRSAYERLVQNYFSPVFGLEISDVDAMVDMHREENTADFVQVRN